MRRRPTIALIALVSVTLLAAAGLLVAGGVRTGTTAGGAARPTKPAVTVASVAPAAVASVPSSPVPPTTRTVTTRRRSHTHPLIPAPSTPWSRVFPGLIAATSSTNWCGYVAASNLRDPSAGSVTDVKGTWVVPTVITGVIANTWNACSDWVGIDGDLGSQTVEQLGTEEDDYYGTIEYYAWWEMYPAVSHQIQTMTISPGDEMTAEVKVSGNTFTLSITDVTTGATFTKQQTSSGTDCWCAEWIHEAPQSTGQLPLTPTTPVPFTACSATINGVNDSIGSTAWQNVAINVQSQADSNPLHYLLAAPSALTSGGTAFTVADSATPPTTTLTATPARNAAGWNDTTVTASMIATDFPGGWPIVGTKYRLNGGATTAYGSPVGISTQGTDTLTYWSIDVAGNVETSRTATCRIDTVAPHTTSSAVASYTGPAVISLTATDALSGVAATYYRLDGGATTTYSVPVTIAPPANGGAVHAMSFWSTDRAGNVETSTTANFTVNALVNSYTLSYTAVGGSIVGSATQLVTSGGSGTTVTATPNAGYHFVSWSDGVLTATRIDTNVTANISVTANFAIDTYTLAPSAGANGAISPPTTQTVNWGSTATFTISPNAGYHVASVLVDGVSVGAVTSYPFTDVTADHTISASFAANSTTLYTLSYAVSGNGAGSIVGSATQVVPLGASGTTVTATPNVGYHFAGWSDGVLTAARADTNVTANISVTASFAVDTFQLHYAAGAGGTISGAASQTVGYGSSGTRVTAKANSGYRFVSWSGGSTANPRTDTNVTANLSVTAAFKRVTSLTITLSRTTVYRHHTVTVSGTISPGMTNGTHVTVQIRESGSVTWYTLSTRNTSGSRWSYGYTPSTRHGTYYVRATYAGSTSYFSCISVSRKLVIY